MANKRDDSSKKHINEIRVSKLKLNLKDEEKIFNKINEHLTDKLSLKKINKETFIKQKWSNIEYKNVSVNIRYALFAWMNYDEKAIVEDNSWFNFLNIL
ncbi:TPA: hypothetical protein DEG21_05810 [Patescibacteria group bacterium]|nr:hypothetical protein [Candidatus Gracilibacteria bacterium]